MHGIQRVGSRAAERIARGSGARQRGEIRALLARWCCAYYNFYRSLRSRSRAVRRAIKRIPNCTAGHSIHARTAPHRNGRNAWNAERRRASIIFQAHRRAAAASFERRWNISGGRGSPYEVPSVGLLCTRVLHAPTEISPHFFDHFRLLRDYVIRDKTRNSSMGNRACYLCGSYNGR